eukprot:2877107-Prymnesium_polylepis.1
MSSSTSVLVTLATHATTAAATPQTSAVRASTDPRLLQGAVILFSYRLQSHPAETWLVPQTCARASSPR